MITVKGSQKDESADRTGNPYAGQAETRLSRLPYIIAGLLSAVALYFQTALQSTAEEAPVKPEPQAQKPGKEGLADEAGPLSAADDAGQDSQGQKPAAKADSKAQGGGAEGLVLSWPSSVQIGPGIARKLPPATNLDIKPFELTPEPDIMASLAIAPADVAASEPLVLPLRSNQSGPAPQPRANAAPKATAIRPALDIVSGTFAIIPVAELMAGVEDADGDALSIVFQSVSSGNLVAVNDGFLYLSDPNTVGRVELTYAVTDGQSITTQVAYLNIKPDVTDGTNVADTITGGSYADDLRGAEGNDSIIGNAGRDVIYGGAGDDTLSGGDGQDLLYGNDGNDQILGGAGQDTLWGGAGNDRLTGEDGNDLVLGEGGNDTLVDGAGADTLAGGDGADVIIAFSDTAADYFEGGIGQDTLNFSAIHSTLVINTIDDRADGSAIGGDKVFEFEAIISGSGNDRFIVGMEDMILTGGGGDDRYEIREGSPSLAGETTIHHILDFNVGDHVHAKGLDLFAQAVDETSSLLDIDHTGSGAIPQINLRYDTFEGQEQTVLEWQCDDVDAYVKLVVDGHHHFGWSTAPAA